jgi:hypothetical protein
MSAGVSSRRRKTSQVARGDNVSHKLEGCVEKSQSEDRRKPQGQKQRGQAKRSACQLTMILTENGRFGVQLYTTHDFIIVSWIVASIFYAIRCSQWTTTDIVYQNGEFNITNMSTSR